MAPAAITTDVTSQNVQSDQLLDHLATSSSAPSATSNRSEQHWMQMHTRTPEAPTHAPPPPPQGNDTSNVSARRPPVPYFRAPLKPDTSSIYHTREAPFVKHLEKWSIWREAYAFSKYLENCASLVARPDDGKLEREEFAQIIDLQYNDGSLHCQERRSLRGDEFDNSPRGDQHINTFCKQISDRSPKVHTQVLILSHGPTPPDDEPRSRIGAKIKLFYAHVLGVEMKLCPSDVALLIGGIPFDVQELWDTSKTASRPLRHNQASFGRSARSHGCLVHWKEGPLSDGSRSDTVIISIRRSWPTRHERIIWPSDSYGIFRPPPYGSAQRGRTPPKDPTVGREVPSPSHRLLIPALHQAIDTDKHSAPNAKSTHWLAAILQVEFCYLRYELDRLNAEQMELEAQIKIKINDRHKMRLLQMNSYKAMSEAVKACIDEAEALLHDADLIAAGERHISLNHVLSQLRRLRRLVQNRLAAAEIAAEQEFKLRNIEMMQLSIDESRNAIALTFLAFIFVPMSLATSVFGMNVQEINGTGSSAWIAVVLAVILTGLSVCALAVWRAWSRWLRNFERNNDVKEEERWSAVREVVKEKAKERHEKINNWVQGIPSRLRDDAALISGLAQERWPWARGLSRKHMSEA